MAALAKFALQNTENALKRALEQIEYIRQADEKGEIEAHHQFVVTARDYVDEAQACLQKYQDKHTA